MPLFSAIILCLLFKGLICSGPSVIIVGSGPSGIAAATKLLKNNITDVIVLEAENRIGGRINSVKFGDGYIDLGAEYCHGQEGNIVYSMVKDLDILRHSNSNVAFYRSNGEIVDAKVGNEIFEFAESLMADNNVTEGCENVTSVGECLEVKYKALIDSIQDVKEKSIYQGVCDWIKGYLCALDSPLDLKDLTITSEYKTCEGDLYMNWNGLGYKTILNVMMQKYPPNQADQLPIDDKILLEKEVTRISYNGKAIVTTKDGGNYEADHVIVTTSVGVLKANYTSLFEPVLPDDKIDAIKNIGFGVVAKTVWLFSERWWADDLEWAFIWTPEDKAKLKEENLEWLVNLCGINQGENNSKVLIAFYAGDLVPHLETLSDEEVMKGIKYFLNTFFKPHYNITMPVEILRTSWYHNPHFRGTYSYESVKGHQGSLKKGGYFQNKLTKPLQNKDGKETVLFAGEATHPTYFSTVHGAIETGYREAERIIKLYEK